MTQDSLTAMWISEPPPSREALLSAVDAVLNEDRAARDKDRWTHIAGGLAVALLCPVLLWCAAHGVTPLVRGGYALMAAGTAILISTQWTYSAWSRKRCPGRRTLARNCRRALSSGASGQPDENGTTMLRPGVHWDGAHWHLDLRERSATEGYLLWALIAVAWFIVSVGGVSSGGKLDERRVRMERLLSDLT